MQPVYQANNVFRFRCPACNLQGDLQVQNGKWVQVQVTHSAPPSVGIGANDRVQIPVAYTLGDAPTASRTKAPPPVDPLEPAFTLGPDGGGELHPSHPMHPMNIRKRIMGEA